MTDTIAQGDLASRAAEAWRNREAERAADAERHAQGRDETVKSLASRAAIRFDPSAEHRVTIDPLGVHVVLDGETFGYDVRAQRLTIDVNCGQCGTTFPLAVKDLAHYGALLDTDATQEPPLCEKCEPPTPADVGWRARVANNAPKLQEILNDLGNEGADPWCVVGDPLHGWTVIARLHGTTEPDREAW